MQVYMKKNFGTFGFEICLAVYIHGFFFQFLNKYSIKSQLKVKKLWERKGTVSPDYKSLEVSISITNFA
jgi:hypothetical protein